MELVLICFVAFASMLPNVLSIECFACETNHETNTTCEDSIVLTNCDHHPEGSRMDSCYTFTFTINNVTEVHKNCSIHSKCPSLESAVCPSLFDMAATSCELECCRGGRCNAFGAEPKMESQRSKSCLQTGQSSFFVFLLLVASRVCLV